MHLYTILSAEGVFRETCIRSHVESERRYKVQQDFGGNRFVYFCGVLCSCLLSSSEVQEQFFQVLTSSMAIVPLCLHRHIYIYIFIVYIFVYKFGVR